MADRCDTGCKEGAPHFCCVHCLPQGSQARNVEPVFLPKQTTDSSRNVLSTRYFLIYQTKGWAGTVGGADQEVGKLRHKNWLCPLQSQGSVLTCETPTWLGYHMKYTHQHMEIPGMLSALSTRGQPPVPLLVKTCLGSSDYLIRPNGLIRSGEIQTLLSFINSDSLAIT